eukprot:TRINITY_DN1027_c0_g1_i2.p1 TRINITY_DN1027_c0_g1~~TRINITY_DN1027_c0_g1_i2.p1  ORF type:complete len:557 (+),score=81.85 TRINITY_DN1027_c0_g1_i2:1518-3188(+)
MTGVGVVSPAPSRPLIRRTGGKEKQEHDSVVACAAYEWPGWSGADNTNTRHATEETLVGRSNVRLLEPKWIFEAAGSMNSQVTSYQGRLYFIAGCQVHSLDPDTAEVFWVYPLGRFTGVEGDCGKGAPVFLDNMFYVGSFSSATGTRLGCGTLDGEYVWSTTVDTHPRAHITASFAIFEETLFVGVASSEDGANQTEYQCCNFRGNMNAFDARTGELKWKTYNVPDNGGRTDLFSGGGIWGSTFPIDPVRRHVYYGTGQPYRLPTEIEDCERARAPEDATCFPEDAHYDSIVALNIDTGEVAWRFRAALYDGYNEWGCSYGPGLDMCPFKDANGFNMDFAQGPMMFQANVSVNGEYQTVDVVGAGQKSGIFWTINRDTGKLVHKSFVGPGGIIGGMMYGSATDGDRIYTASTNSFQIQHKLTGTEYIAPMYGGFWSALDVNTGKILWDQADPSWRDEPLPIYGLAKARPYGSVLVANGVVYAGTTDEEGWMYGLDAQTGAILWRYSCGYGVGQGATMRNGVLYFGCGNASFGGVSAPLLFAFHLPPGAEANNDISA